MEGENKKKYGEGWGGGGGGGGGGGECELCGLQHNLALRVKQKGQRRTISELTPTNNKPTPRSSSSHPHPTAFQQNENANCSLRVLERRGGCC